MDCKDIRFRLQELLDQTLSKQESVRVERHLQACASCLAHHRQLQALSRAIAALPDYSPSPAFTGGVLSALGLEEATCGLPQWAKWIIGSFCSLASCGAAAAILLALSRLSLWQAARGFELLSDPSQAAVLAKFYFLRSALMLGDCWQTLRAWGPIFGPETAHLPLESAAAAVLAGFFMAAVLRKTSLGAATAGWGTI